MEIHARTLIETAIAMTSRDFVTAILAGVEVAQKGKRGRKPGAAAAADRCTWVNGDKQCKNKHVEESTYCKLHAGKAAALPSADDHAASD